MKIEQYFLTECHCADTRLRGVITQDHTTLFLTAHTMETIVFCLRRDRSTKVLEYSSALKTGVTCLTESLTRFCEAARRYVREPSSV